MAQQSTQRDIDAVNAVIKAYDVRGVVGDQQGQINEGFARDVGASFARLMRAEGAKSVVVGHDMRDSSPGLAAAFIEGVTAQGLDAVILGLTRTDELYFALGVGQCPGMMRTAPLYRAQYNGIKLCRAGSQPFGQGTGLERIV